VDQVHFFLTSFSSSLSSVFALLFSCYARFVISFFLSDISNDTIFLALSFKSFQSAFQRFVFAYFNCCQLSHHLLGLYFLHKITYFYSGCQPFSKISSKQASAPSLKGFSIFTLTMSPTFKSSALI